VELSILWLEKVQNTKDYGGKYKRLWREIRKIVVANTKDCGGKYKRLWREIQNIVAGNTKDRGGKYKMDDYA
jgi:hypothetical protein